MRIPDSLTSLVDEGIIEEVVRPLMSGKEAQVFLVRSGGELRVAKVYKQAQDRTFKHRAQYTEGRTVRNSRDQRAMNKRTRHGRAQDETAWRSAEVDMIYRLRDAGVRVPMPHHYLDGVLIMELVTDAEGNPAPRLADVQLLPDAARKIFEHLLSEVVRMLSAGVVHGDLSDFNVLIGTDGPVIIDFPQSVNAAGNQNARKLLMRDVDNLHRFVAPYFPERQPPPYAQEMWLLYERGELTPDTHLRGRYRPSEKQANTDEVLQLVGDAEHDERRRREKLGIPLRGTSNRQVVVKQRRPSNPGNMRAVDLPAAPERRPSDPRAPTATQRGPLVPVVMRRHGQPARGNVAAPPAPRPQTARDDANRGRAQAAPMQDITSAPKRKRQRRRRKDNAGGTSSGHTTGAPAPHSGPAKSVKDAHRSATPHPPSPAKHPGNAPGGRHEVRQVRQRRG
ncbi:MAG TPA: PA4780 family RIO1-like protein kinase [Polyangiaceae bacterium]|nr:PA4780 family RIO1-like protein kinase [Polyangiaceae bacterium]